MLLALGLVGASGAVFEPGAAASPRDGPCTAAQTRRVVTAFMRAWTRGDTTASERLVAPEPLFRWVSVGWAGRRLGGRASDRATLRTYLAARYRKHDRLELRSFRFNGSDVREQHRYGHFGLTAFRDADDWPSGLGHIRPGKGAIICILPQPVIAVFSLG
jgi:hypothetical protein